MKEKPMGLVATRGLFLVATAAGAALFVWAIYDVLPIASLRHAGAFLTVIFGLVGLLFWRIRLDPFYALMVLGIPSGLIFSVVEIVRTLQEMNDPAGIPVAISSALAVALVGGLLSAVGSFGFERSENIRSRCLKGSECLVLSGLLVMLLLGMMFNFNVLVAFMDWSSAKVLLSILLVGVGVATLRQTDVRDGLPNLFVCVALIGAAISTIGWILTSLTGDSKGAGPAIAIGLVTMLYGIFLYILSFVWHLSASDTLDDQGFTTKNWHLMEGFTFLFFMNFGPPTLFEMLPG